MKGLKQGAFYYSLLIVTFLMGARLPVAAQVIDSFNESGISILNDFKYDSNMVHSYEHLFGLEVYVQNKNLKIRNTTLLPGHTYDYNPNANLSVGLGFTYRYLALSAAVNVLPVNNNKDLKTKSLDFQSQVAGYRTLSFINVQLYKGFTGDFNKDYDHAAYRMTRPDIGFTLLGLNNMYALNKRYSFRGSVLRFQRMKYSVGTPILAFDANYWVKSGDSAYVSSSGIDLNFFGADMERRRIWNLGLGGGYAYTWVPNKRWLFAGIVTVKLPINFVKERLDERYSEAEKYWIGSGLNTSLWLRSSYERDDWSISLHYIYSQMLVGKQLMTSEFSGNYGMARLMFSRRFGMGRKFKKAVKPIDAILDVPFKILGSK